MQEMFLFFRLVAFDCRLSTYSTSISFRVEELADLLFENGAAS